MKRLLLDQGLPRSTAALLTQAGWGVLHVSEIGMSRADDADILRRARAESRVCVTLDADFHPLLATGGKRSPSVIRVRKEGLDAAAFAALLQGIWPRIEDALDSGALVTDRSAAIAFPSQLPVSSSPVLDPAGVISVLAKSSPLNSSFARFALAHA